MCVIAVCVKSLPTEAELRQMECANSAGGGMSWIEKDKVRWAKGYKAKHLFAMAKSLPLPVIFHFRLATVGGQDKLLCHPFAVTEKSELFRNGIADSVLFHNGHESHWELLASAAGVKLEGPVSDSRALAAITAKNGNVEWLKKPSGIFAVMDKDGITRIGNFTEDNGIFYSNQYWRTYGSYAGAGNGRSYAGDHGWGGDYESGSYYERMRGSRGTRPTIVNGRHWEWCNCDACIAKRTAVTPNLHLKKNGLHPKKCPCLDCRIDALYDKTVRHHAECVCDGCESWVKLVRLRADLWAKGTDTSKPDALLVLPKPDEIAQGLPGHPKECQCHFCEDRREENEALAATAPGTTVPVQMEDANEGIRETVAVTVTLPGGKHSEACCCRQCIGEWQAAHPTNAELDAKAAKKPTGERPSGHGDDCRCGECREAIHAQIVADHTHELNKRSGAHMLTNGDNGELQPAPSNAA